MRKRELVHFHALLDRIRRFAAERGDLSPDALDEYEALDVAPTAVYRSKEAHEEAVVTLTESLATGIAAEATPGEETSTSGFGDEETAEDDYSASARSD